MQTVDILRKVSADIAAQAAAVLDRSTLSPSLLAKLESLFFDPKPTQVWYFLEVAYTLLMPASAAVTEEVWEFQVRTLFFKTCTLDCCSEIQYV